MENLSALIKSLTPGEEKLIRHFYKLRDFGEYRKRVELLDAIESGKARDEDHLAQLIGYKKQNTSYHNLKSRLKSDIVCILLMQESSSKFNSPYAQAVFSCRRALLTGEILLSRGVYQEGMSLLRKAARVAEKFELFAERILAEDTLRNHSAGSNSAEELQEGTNAIEKNYRLLGNVMQSKKKLYQTVFSESSSVEEEQEPYSTKQILTELDHLQHESESSRVRFYSQLSRFNIFNHSGDTENALHCAKDLLTLIEKDPVIMSKSNQGGIEMEIAGMYLRSMDFSNAIEHATRAAALFRSGMLNHLRALTVIFYGQVHSGLYANAQLTLDTLLSSRCLKDRAHVALQNRLVLLKAWFAFVNGEFDVTTSSMKQCTELSKERGPWFFGYSIMECMVLIEKNASEAALYKLDALRKCVTRAGKELQGKRVLAIIGVLRNLVRVNNDHAELLRLNPGELHELQNCSEDCTWDPTGFELVRIEEWVRRRAGYERQKQH